MSPKLKLDVTGDWEIEVALGDVFTTRFTVNDLRMSRTITLPLDAKETKRLAAFLNQLVYAGEGSDKV